MKHGSLFSGIGGFDLGFERAGIETVWQVEIDPYCRRVLERHFPGAARYADIRECCGPRRYRLDKCEYAHQLAPVDILSGGFPCQDISDAGKRQGIDGERSGLWREYARLIGELRPRFAVLENVAALLHRGMGRVLGDLAEIGYDAEWASIRASDVGAPHIRERIWIIAYPAEFRRDEGFAQPPRFFGAQRMGDADGERRKTRPGLESSESHGRRARPCDRCGVAHSNFPGLERAEREELARTDPRRFHAYAAGPDWWAVEPDVGRMAHGVSARVDRLKGLGNAIVPQIAEWIGRQIVAAAERMK